jgi:FMN-dependent NADH-azoreductase
MKLLHIDSSILGAHSVSRQLTRDIVSQWRASHPGTVVDYLDLAVDNAEPPVGRLHRFSRSARQPRAAERGARTRERRVRGGWFPSSWPPMWS